MFTAVLPFPKASSTGIHRYQVGNNRATCLFRRGASRRGCVRQGAEEGEVEELFGGRGGEGN